MDILEAAGIGPRAQGAYAGRWLDTGGGTLTVTTPITGEAVAELRMATAADLDATLAAAHEAWRRWREVPAPRRGELVRRIAEELRARKDALGRLVSYEVGKILPEGLGEVQEAIDIADFAVGLSRQLHGLTIASERPTHHMRETWQPLGVVGVITAFNFPVAVWAWNAMLALVCGDALVWKPSLKAPLCAVAMTKIAAAVLEPEGFGALCSLVVGEDPEVGEGLIADRRVPLVSATGSTRMGRRVAEVVGARLGRTLLELGGNNAVIVLDDADLDLALRAILFGAVGTAGQRCTTTRRLYVQRGVAGELERRLRAAYASVPVGDPLAEGTLCGPLIDADAVARMQAALAEVPAQGGEVLCGGEPLRLDGKLAGGAYVRPCLVRARPGMDLMQHECFAPILYLCEVADFDEALALQNDVPQGLSSALFTGDVRLAERFLSAAGSDCGIANVNLGTSGAEIGGAFGGEKDTGGGRESGSDAWKAYMRRQTATVNWGRDLPLAQGIRFGD
ncbi:MAG: aldehyde dehydrogenase family protein [Planctomycetota bacterium]